MRGPHNIFRLVRTVATFERTGALRIALNTLDASRGVKIASRILGWPFIWLGLKGDPKHPPVLRALNALGPAYIKFGQTLSTRPDVVGGELAEELKVLQDQLPAFPTEDAKKTIKSELGENPDRFFSHFSEPVAAASIAQVHMAVLKGTGTKVAVKVLRPNVERAFRRDIDAFYLAADVISFLSPGARRLRPRDVIAHFEGVVMRELDLRMEASAADEFANSNVKDKAIGVPAVRWSLSGKRVLTLDWIEGIKLSDKESLVAAGHDTVALSRGLMQMFLRTALRDGHFHADMHQGNLKVSSDGTIMMMDFGIMGRIDDYTRRVYAEILMGFIRRDYLRVAHLHFEAGYVPADRDVYEFAQALRSVGEPIFGIEAGRISMARLLAHLFEVTEQFGMETRTELILLQRTMVVVEGVARSLDPNLNIWQTARPVVEDYIKRHVGPAAVIRDVSQAARVFARFGPQFPHLVESVIHKLEDNPAPPKQSNNWLWFAFGVLTAVSIMLLIFFL